MVTNVRCPHTGVRCAKGAGWCQEGHYCGMTKGSADRKCLPLPADCGKPGKRCCPSNARTPHTASTEPLSCKPFCEQGSICFFHPEELYTSGNPDPHSGATGYACVAVPSDCGSPGRACCPSTYHTGTNPSLGSPVCQGNAFCDYDSKDAPKFAGADLLPGAATGTCTANSPDCGQLGKPCCISNGGSSTALGCTPGGGTLGYCATAAGLTFSDVGSKLRELVCTACPAKVDDSLKSSKPVKYSYCKKP